MRIVVTNHITLDGVMQSPASPDEDTRDGFELGGWGQAGNDEVMFQKLGEWMGLGGALLLGRRTYEHFYGFWPKQTDNPFTEVLNNTQKYVASTTLQEPLPWENSTLLKGDVPAQVAELKHQEGGELVVLGSGALIQSLMPHGLIDEYRLMIHPRVLGSGRKLFAEGVPDTGLRLVESVTNTTGVVIATYQAA
jgi:dihydrofolate reductase